MSLALLPTALVVSDDLSPEPGRLDDLDHDEGIEDQNGKVGNQLSQNKLKSQNLTMLYFSGVITLEQILCKGYTLGSRTDDL